jgi:glutathione synthase
MKIIAQINDISTLNFENDSTIAILLEAQNRGYEIFYYTSNSLTMQGEKIFALVSKIELFTNKNNFFKIKFSKFENLSLFDALLIREDPPFNMNYLTCCYFLEKIKDQIFIMNNPSAIKDCSEKIFVTKFQKFMPKTMISSNFQAVKEFRNKIGKIILKPLYAGAGAGIFLDNGNEKNLEQKFNEMISLYKSPLVAQEYLPNIKNGDKRILLLNGQIIGYFNRIPAQGKITSNLATGGVAAKAELTKIDQQICNEIAGDLQKLGMYFVGIDIIDGKITEINNTSPTGIKNINNLYDLAIENKIIDFIEQKVLNNKKTN